ncbi:hypothetical protein GGI07_002274 [Coemansia sp. Benny D115]|nr:hypothetical protein GGI07_002274 [Coemansia sp. Benny D115]
MPPYSQFYTRVGQTLGQSPRASTKTTTQGPTALLKPLLGRQAFVQEISTDNLPADVLLAPRLPGDLAVVHMDGAQGMFVRKPCLLAQTKFLQVSTWKGLGATFHALAFDRVDGKGAVVLNAFGSIHRLVLNEGEEYLVDPRYVVAWSSTLDVAPQSGRPQPLVPKQHTGEPASETQPQQTASSATSTGNLGAKSSDIPRVAPLMSNSPAITNQVAAPAPSPAQTNQSVSASTLSKTDKIKQSLLSSSKNISTKAFAAAGNALRSLIYSSANVVRTGGWAAAKTTKTLAGVPDLYRVSGPGEIYVSTRLMPRPWRRITDTIAAKSSVSA